MKNVSIVFWMVLISIAVSGCASVTFAPPEESDRAKVMPVPEGKGLVYIYRPSIFLGDAVGFDILANGQMIGVLVKNAFYLIEASEGNLEIISKTQNTETLKLQILSGTKYFVRVVARPGFFPGFRSTISAMNPVKGPASISGKKLIKHVKL